MGPCQPPFQSNLVFFTHLIPPVGLRGFYVPPLRLQATKTGQLNTILTFYEISNPPLPSALSGVPESLLRSAIAILAKGGRAQLISISDGDGVRFFPRTVK